MAKRVKKVVHSGITSDQMEQAFSSYAAADARLAKINSTMDVEMTRIRDKYAEEVNRLSDQKDQAFDVLQAFALENREELFAKKKSMETIHGLIGFRTGTPKLKTLKGYTWNAVTNLLKEFLPSYVRISEEPAKDRLLADRENEEVAPMLARVGVMVDQEESFYVELKKESEL